MFIENSLAAEITMSVVKIQVVVFRDKFGVKHMIKYSANNSHWV